MSDASGGQGVPQNIAQRIKDTAEPCVHPYAISVPLPSLTYLLLFFRLSAARRKRKAPADHATPADLKTYAEVDKVTSLHSTKPPGVTTVDVAGASGELLLTGGSVTGPLSGSACGCVCGMQTDHFPPTGTTKPFRFMTAPLVKTLPRSRDTRRRSPLRTSPAHLRQLWRDPTPKTFHLSWFHQVQTRPSVSGHQPNLGNRRIRRLQLCLVTTVKSPVYRSILPEPWSPRLLLIPLGRFTT